MSLGLGGGNPASPKRPNKFEVRFGRRGGVTTLPNLSSSFFFCFSIFLTNSCYPQVLLSSLLSVSFVLLVFVAS